jgi:hypothetical protein
MAALGIEPALVEEAVAAAVCGLSVERFVAECPLAGVQVGTKRLYPLDEVKAWAVRWWARKTGARPANDSIEGEGRDWLGTLDEDAG